MYIERFGLSQLPFENVPDPVFFFDQGDYHQIRRRLENSLKALRGLIVVTGPIGSGKTTLSQMIKSDFCDDIKLVWLAEPPANSKELMMFLVQELGLEPSSSRRVFVLRDIRDALLNMNSKGGRCLMIMDESHLISDDTLNGIRLLNNLEEGSTKLIQVLMLGQEEFIETINRPEMEPFKQRIAALEMIGKMDADRVCEYVSHRIQVAGGDPSIFTGTGWKAISVAFNRGGVPRTVNTLCDQCFIVAHEKNKAEIDAHDVYEATERLGLKTDVFHYIVGLKSQARENQAQSAARPDSFDKTDAYRHGPDRMPHHTALIENKMERQIPRYSHSFIPEPKQKSNRLPLLILAISIITLVISILFYYDRSTCPDLSSCLLEFISF